MKVSDKHFTEHASETGATRGTKHKGSVSKPSISSTPMDESGEVSSAKVKLSGRAQDMKKIREAVDKQPDVDEAKVAKYKSLIASGEYKVDSGAVADKMVDEHAYSDLFFGKEE